MFHNPVIDGLVVLIVLLLIVGPKKLPGLGRGLGDGMREFKEGITGEHKHEQQQQSLSQAQTVPQPQPQPTPSAEQAPPAQSQPAHSGAPVQGSSERSA